MTTLSMYNRPGGFTSGHVGVIERAKRVLQYRRILKLLVRRDLKVRYAGSALGYVWTVLDPLLMSFVYFFVFTQVFNRGGRGEEPFILFLVSGQLMWAWFNGGVSGAAKSLRAESQMVRSSNVPRELWVLRVICSKFVEYVFSLPVLALFAIAYAKVPTWHIVLMPVAWAFMFLLLGGLGLILAPITVLVRDTERIIPIVLRVLFYMSPVLYSIKSVTHQVPALRRVYELNPVVGPLEIQRAAFFPDEFKFSYVWHSAIVCTVVFAIGLYTFTRLERQVLKEV